MSEVATADDKRRLGHREWVGIGIVSGLVAFMLVPVVFGPMSIFSGLQVYRRHDEMHGLAVMALGGIGLVLGFIIGMQTGV